MFSARRSENGGSLFFALLRPAPSLKSARWRTQDAPAAAVLNGVARSVLQNNTPIWDGFEFSRGVEISLSRDGTHYNHLALTVQGALLLEALAHSLVQNHTTPSAEIWHGMRQQEGRERGDRRRSDRGLWSPSAELYRVYNASSLRYGCACPAKDCVVAIPVPFPTSLPCEAARTDSCASACARHCK